MSKIFKNLIPYWRIMIVILLLLVVQAYCDLSLPQLTSNIIDVGIQNKGFTHIVPEKITSEDYELAQIFMTEDEKQIWADSYTENEDLYLRSVSEEESLTLLDEELMTPLVLSYKMANTSEADFKSMIKSAFESNPQTASMAASIDTMTIDEIASVMQVELVTFQAEDENGNAATYVDMRPIVQIMINSGQMSQTMLEESRTTMEDAVAKIGSSTIASMGVAFAISASEDAGVDVDGIQMSYLWSQGGKMFLMAMAILIAATFVGFFSARVGAGIGRNLRTGIYGKVLSFSSTEMDKFSTASLITRSTNDIQQIQMVTTMMLRMILYAPILGIGGVYKVIQTKANMGWIIVLALLAIFGMVFLLIKIAMPKFKIMQQLVDRLNLVSREILTGLSVIRAFGREEREEERFEEANVDLTNTQLFTSRVMVTMMPGLMFVMYGLSVAIIWVASHRIDAGTLEVGTMTAFIQYSMQIVMSFLMLTMLSIMLPRAGVAADRVDEVLRTETAIREIDEPKKISDIKGVVTFEQVAFRYPEAMEDAVSDISFTAEPGKTTAIIGSTGSGKSTIANLLPRFYDVTSGKITIDGVDIRELELHDLRSKIGFVPQKGVLFSGTIASNLRFGDENASDEEISLAAEIAQAKDFIDEKKERFDSEISQGGTNVSGGQKQRLSIARAIAKKPKIFVFDDSFSALDMKTDVALRKSLEEKISDATVLIVAQRISTIIHAHQILVVNDGMIVGKGTHEELLKTCEVYQEIAKSQLSLKELGIEEGEEVSHE
ncbi:MAG: ABC transporter ATP-binding protein [Lachnospiraceae bacterium]